MITVKKGAFRRRVRNVWSLFFCVFFISQTPNHGADRLRRQEQREMTPNVVVVKFKTLALGKNVATPSINRITGVTIDHFEPVLHSSRGLKKPTRSVGLERVFYAHYSDSRSPQEVAKALSEDSAIEYAEPKYVHHICAMPNDSLISLQNIYLNHLQLYDAWDLVKAESSAVVIAIVDGGTNILHKDLAANLWHNADEIANNGLDDDQNGFIDDLHGWNFAQNIADPTGLSNTPVNAMHGTHVAGICCAVTNNHLGIAGSSWNAKFMAINTGSPYSDNAIIYGYDGILYAAENGADIINCSWGSLGSTSLYEQDVVQHALTLGSVVVAAAGNENDSTAHYPSSYDGVLSVAALSYATNSKASYSNYGKNVDVAAPGAIIYGTTGLDSYTSLNGTSMAAPLVSGIVALVKARHPDWNDLQAAEQVRMTCTNIDSDNPAYIGKLGRGLVNAYAALTSAVPSIRIAQVRYTDANGDGIIKPGEDLKLYITLINYLAHANTINLTLTEDSPYVDINGGSLTLNELGPMQTIEPTTPFAVTIRSDAPRGHVVSFTLAVQSGSYHDVDQFSLSVLPTFGNIEINHLATTVTSIGRIGFSNTVDGEDGIGFKYQKGHNLLFEGAILCGVGPNRISNTARGIKPPGQSLQYDDDFLTTEDGGLQFFTPGQRSSQESYGVFNDANADSAMNLRITQKTYADQSNGLQDFVLFEYQIENQGAETLTPFHFGIFFDWDIDGGHYSTNMVKYDPARKMTYVYDDGDGPDTFVGVTLLDEAGVSCRAIWNEGNNPLNTTWGIYDGFSDAEKWECLSSGTVNVEAGPGDISHVIAAGPFTLAPNERIALHFALAAGADFNKLCQAVDAAKTFNRSMTADKKSQQATTWSLSANHPNPFNSTTVIAYELQQTARVTLELFDLLGRKINTLVDQTQAQGKHRIVWNGCNELNHPVPSGAYFYRLQAGAFSKTRKLILLR